jgi:phosphoglycolate phosphatase-like HAD superfamily hydrolase
MNDEYLRREISGERAYLRRESLENLKAANALIFDCDGVLIDIRESYNRANSQVVAFMIEELTGSSFAENLVSREIVYLFKKSGGFNNDWDLTFVLLTTILCKLPKDFRVTFKKLVKLSQSEKALLRRFFSVKEGIGREFDPATFNNLRDALEYALKETAEKSDAFGIVSFEEKLIKDESKELSDFYAAAKSFLSYPGSVGESLLTTVYEEIFCGPQLFKDLYGQEPQFYWGKGLIENEKVIIQSETLKRLASTLSEKNFGIASGRQRKLTEHVLKDLLDGFDLKASVFLDDIEAAEQEATRSEGIMINLKKPNPYSLLRSSKGLKPFRLALYVGDSMEDAMVVKEANRLDPRFLFTGVYRHSDCEEDVLNDFLKAEADIILPSVNELPELLEAIKEEG